MQHIVTAAGAVADLWSTHLPLPVLAVLVAALLRRATVVVTPHVTSVLDGHVVLRASVVGAEGLAALVHLAHAAIALDIPGAGNGCEARWASDGVAVLHFLRHVRIGKGG